MDTEKRQEKDGPSPEDEQAARRAFLAFLAAGGALTAWYLLQGETPPSDVVEAEKKQEKQKPVLTQEIALNIIRMRGYDMEEMIQPNDPKVFEHLQRHFPFVSDADMALLKGKQLRRTLMIHRSPQQGRPLEVVMHDNVDQKSLGLTISSATSVIRFSANDEPAVLRRIQHGKAVPVAPLTPAQQQALLDALKALPVSPKKPEGPAPQKKNH